MTQLVSIFFNVIAPVFGVVIIGYLVAKPLDLQARTLSRAAYYVFIPCFIFNVIGSAEVEGNLVVRMIAFAVVAHLAVAVLGYGVARALGHGPKMCAAFVIVAIFGNVGNFGLPLIEFRLGSEAILPATIYFLGILTISFIVCVSAASYVTGGSLGAMKAVTKTPALLALVPAVFVNALDLPVPLLVTRMTGLLGSAMVPIMLLGLGVQLASSTRLRLSRDIVMVSAVRLIGSAVIAFALVIPFGLTGVERGAGIFQSAMPAAVLCSIIAIEYDVEPDFVTKSVLFSTIASVVTLTVVLGLV